MCCSNISVCLWNSRSLVNKSKLFYPFTISSNLDIFAITETWCTPEVYNNELFNSNYSVFRKDRSSRGGGVLLAVNNSFPCKQIPSPPDIELICVELVFPKPIVVCVVYIPPPPSVPVITQLCEFLSSIPTTLIIMGDFNCPDIDWLQLTGSTQASKLFCDLVFNVNLVQLVNFPSHTGGNTLDLVLTNAPNLISNLQPLLNKPISTVSDHIPLSFAIENINHKKTPVNSTVPSYLFHLGDYDSIRNHLLFVSNFDKLQASVDIEQIWSDLKSSIMDAISRYVPKFCPRSRSFPKWFSPELKHSANKLRSLRKQAKKPLASTNTKTRCTQAEDQFYKDTCSARIKYETELINSCSRSNSSSIFKHIKSIFSVYSSPSCFLWNSISFQCQRQCSTVQLIFSVSFQAQ